MKEGGREGGREGWREGGRDRRQRGVCKPQPAAGLGARHEGGNAVYMYSLVYSAWLGLGVFFIYQGLQVFRHP